MTWGLPFTGYIVAQVFTVLALRPPWRWAALLPAPVMAWIAYATHRAFTVDSPQAPLLLILASLPALVFLLVLYVLSRGATRKV